MPTYRTAWLTRRHQTFSNTNLSPPSAISFLNRQQAQSFSYQAWMTSLATTQFFLNASLMTSFVAIRWVFRALFSCSRANDYWFQRIRLLPNPARFSLNDISFAVCSVDVLYHLRKEEYFRRGQEVDSIVCEPEAASDPMSNLSRYVLQQRRWHFCNNSTCSNLHPTICIAFIRYSLFP